MKMDNSYDGISYQHDFMAGPEWKVLDLPFSQFKPNFRGQMVANRPPLRGPAMRQLGFMVSKFSDVGGLTPGFRSGRFRLAVRWMKGFL